jgi:hypothetical protein
MKQMMKMVLAVAMAATGGLAVLSAGGCRRTRRGAEHPPREIWYNKEH